MSALALVHSGRGTSHPNEGRERARRLSPVSGMMRRIVHRSGFSAMSPTESTDRPVSTATNWSSLSSALHAVHERLGRKAAEQLAVITDHDTRTAQRFFSQDRVPNGNAVFLMATDPTTGPAFLLEGSRRLSVADRERFWLRMIVAGADAIRAKAMATET